MAVEPGEQGEESGAGVKGPGGGQSGGGHAADGRECAGGGEEEADEELFFEQAGEAEGGQGERGVDAGEVSQGGDGEGGVALACGDGHLGEDEPGGGEGGGDGDGEQESAMPVMEAVPVAEGGEVGGAQGGTGVEEAVADVDGPGGEGEEWGNPEGQADLGCRGEGQRPDDGDGGGVQAGEVPQAGEMPEA